MGRKGDEEDEVLAEVLLNAINGRFAEPSLVLLTALLHFTIRGKEVAWKGVAGDVTTEGRHHSIGTGII